MIGGTNFTSTVTGNIWKEVHCTNCSQIYYYPITRETTGGAASFYGFRKDKAAQLSQDRAERRLRKAFENDVELIPCPHCSAYQPEMFAELRKRKFKTARKRTGILFGIGAFLLLGAYMVFRDGDSGQAIGLERLNSTHCLLGSATATLLAFLSHIHCKWQEHAYDPNEHELNDRRLLARKSAYTAEQFQKLKDEGRLNTNPLQGEITQILLHSEGF